MLTDYFRDAEIVLVDDEASTLRLLTHVLARKNLGRVTATADPREALQLCLWREPDLIVLDLHMPHMHGVSFLRELKSALLGAECPPVIVVTGDASSEAMEAAFTAGARDFLTKPLDSREVILRVRNQLEIRFLAREVQKRNEELEQRVQERTRHLHQAQVEILERLARAAEYRDDDTGEHAKRVGEMSAQIADILGLPAEDVELIWRAATLHDVGKIGVTDTILLKPGKLTEAEMSVMKTHAEIGAAILSGGDSPYMRMAERIALSHHERWDGTGYRGIAGEAIPLEGRIVAVADVFDALIHERPYKDAWPIEEAVALIKSQRGQQFDPMVVDAFLQVLHNGGSLPEGDRSDRIGSDASTEPADDARQPLAATP